MHVTQDLGDLDSSPAQNLNAELAYGVDVKRWFVLFGFCIFSCNQCLTWFTFSSTDLATMQGYFGARMTKATVDALLNWGPIAGILVFPLQVWITTRQDGLRKGIWLGIGLGLLGNALRSYPVLVAEINGDRAAAQSDHAFWLYHAGQILNAASGPLCMGTCTLLSVVWFAENERTSATACAWTANGVGTTIGFLNPLWLAPDAAGVPRLFYVSLALSIVPVICAAIYLPARPPLYPSAAAVAASSAQSAPADLSSAELLESAREARRDGHRMRSGSLLADCGGRSFLMLIMASGVMSGILIGWQGVLQSILSPAGLSDKAIGWIGFGNAGASNVAALVSGWMIDNCFRRRLKAGIIVGLAGVLLSLLWFMLGSPCFLYGGPPWGYSQASLVLACTLCGFAQGVTQPLLYELSAELLYPQKESTSAGILVFICNGASMVMIQLNTSLDPDKMNFVAFITVAMVLLAIATGVREEYRRPQGAPSCVS